MTWTFYDPYGNDITPTPPPTGPISLVYSDDGQMRDPAGRIISTIICSTSDDPVTVQFVKGSHANALAAEHTQVTRSPVSAGDLTWTVGTGDIVTVSVPNGSENNRRGGWSWAFAPAESPDPVAPIGLRIKIKVSRPPVEGRIVSAD